MVRPMTAAEAKSTAAGFRSPPVSEVSLAVAFQPVTLSVIAAGDLWRAEFKDAYPKVEEQGPVRMPVERFEGVPISTSTLKFELSEGTLPLPRLWFVSDTGSELVQLQRDWFARNWRQPEGAAAGTYPLYPAAREAFDRDLRKVDGAVGPLRPLQAEIVYINHIEAASIASVLVAMDPSADITPEFESYASQYVLTRGGSPVGRVYLQAQKAVRRSSGEPVIVLTITVRGAPVGTGVDGVLRFLDIGSEEALVAFIQATRPELHEKWRSA